MVCGVVPCGSGALRAVRGGRGRGRRYRVAGLPAVGSTRRRGANATNDNSDNTNNANKHDRYIKTPF